MRGAYTCGVLDAFLDHDIEVDGLIGVSAGICHGCSYVSKQRGRAFRVMSDYLRDPRYMSMRSPDPNGRSVQRGICLPYAAGDPGPL